MKAPGGTVATRDCGRIACEKNKERETQTSSTNTQHSEAMPLIMGLVAGRQLYCELHSYLSHNVCYKYLDNCKS